MSCTKLKVETRSSGYRSHFVQISQQIIKIPESDPDSKLTALLEYFNEVSF